MTELFISPEGVAIYTSGLLSPEQYAPGSPWKYTCNIFVSEDDPHYQEKLAQVQQAFKKCFAEGAPKMTPFEQTKAYIPLVVVKNPPSAKRASKSRLSPSRTPHLGSSQKQNGGTTARQLSSSLITMGALNISPKRTRMTA
jgi:hypothetical protein